MSKCSTCLQSKKDTDFYVRKSGDRKGQIYEKCKECMKSRGRNYYHQNRGIQLPKARIRNKQKLIRNLALLLLLKEAPCADCGRKFYPWQMDFDHRSGSGKEENVSSMALRDRNGLAPILREIKKCDLVCANCHRTRTKERRISSNYENAEKYLKIHRQELEKLVKAE